jgi:6-pyruvoyltetrahydropterin/6-carboxytetrahydropterin synthase
MVVDFADLKAAVREKILDRVDHQNLNDLLENPTAEIIAAWVWRELREAGLPIHEIRLWETSACYVAYRGEEEAGE